MNNTLNKDNRSLYQRLHDAGVSIDNYQSDLYFPHNSVTIAIVNQAISDGVLHKKPILFQNKVDGAAWNDAMFQYDPFWKGDQPLNNESDYE